MDQTTFNPTPGTVEQIAPDVRRILAPNPSPMTFRGTNTYLLGSGQVALIDPGPDSAVHMDAILAALQDGEIISHIFVTHSHLDHSPLARAMSQHTQAAIYAYGDSRAGRSAMMETLAHAGLTGGGEGVDADFAPDICLKDGDTIAGGDWSLTALWTPGHYSNHMCFSSGNALFSGDMVMGWASTMVSPPDGDLSQFMASCARLFQRDETVYHPGHGAPITNPRERVNWLLNHRQSRESQIISQLRSHTATTHDITCAIYSDIAPALLPAAERNVFAHLIDLHQKKLVSATPELSLSARFELL